MSLIKWFLKVISTGSTGMSRHSILRDAKDTKTKINDNSKKKKKNVVMFSNLNGFQMPLHYPRYKKDDYEMMEEWKLDVLLREYGLACEGSIQEKRAYVIGAFLWPDPL